MPAAVDGQGESRTRIRLQWTESDGPAVVPPWSEGFGMQLIGQALTYELGATAQVEWNHDGLSCAIEFPKE